METMSILDQTQKIVEMEDDQEKERDFALTDLAFRIEFDDSLKKEDIIAVTILLLNAALLQKKQFPRNDFLNAIDEIDLHRHIAEYIDWDEAVQRFPDFSIDDMIWFLPWIGHSKQEKYLPFLEQYTRHTTKIISEYAFDAINDIKKKG